MQNPLMHGVAQSEANTVMPVQLRNNKVQTDISLRAKLTKRDGICARLGNQGPIHTKDKAKSKQVK